MDRMLVNCLLLCFLIGSILQGSLCDTDNNSNSTDDDASNEDSSATLDIKGIKSVQSAINGTDTNDKGTDTNDKDSTVSLDSEEIEYVQNAINGTDTNDKDNSFVVVENVHQYQENVTLDPNTAHPLLKLSGDLQSVSLGSSRQDLDNNTDRFDSDPCVLGSTGYTSGKHFFKTSGDGGFLVGFAAVSVPRKGPLVLSSDAGIFAYPRAMGDTPDVVGTLLDCDQDQVLFYDESSNEVVSNLRMPNGCSEEMRPFFFIAVGELVVS